MTRSTQRFLQSAPPVLIMAGVILLSSFFIEYFENQRIWGDEIEYIKLPHKQVEEVSPLLSILPGQLGLYWQPPLAVSVYSFFTSDRLVQHYIGSKRLEGEEFISERNRFIRRISYFNMALLCISGVLLYSIARLIGLSPVFASIATSLTVFNPRVLFYLQSLWPELLHFVLMLSATFFFMVYCTRKKVAFLCISSMLFGYCMFAKGIALYYILLLVVALAISERKYGRHRVFSVVLAFIAPYSVLILSQNVANVVRHDRFALSSNTWINIEAGIIPREAINQEGYDDVFVRYFSVSSDSIRREAESKERVFEYIQKTSLLNIIENQLFIYHKMINHSFLKRGVDKQRWRNSEKLISLGIIASFLSWTLFVLGSIGAVICSKSDVRVLVAAIFVFYYMAVLFVVGFNPRFFVQAVPFLSLFAALLLQRLAGKPKKDGAEC